MPLSLEETKAALSSIKDATLYDAAEHLITDLHEHGLPTPDGVSYDRAAFAESVILHYGDYRLELDDDLDALFYEEGSLTSILSVLNFPSHHRRIRDALGKLLL